MGHLGENQIDEVQEHLLGRFSDLSDEQRLIEQYVEPAAARRHQQIRLNLITSLNLLLFMASIALLVIQRAQPDLKTSMKKTSFYCEYQLQ